MRCGVCFPMGSHWCSHGGGDLVQRAPKSIRDIASHSDTEAFLGPMPWSLRHNPTAYYSSASGTSAKGTLPYVPDEQFHCSGQSWHWLRYAMVCYGMLASRYYNCHLVPLSGGANSTCPRGVSARAAQGSRGGCARRPSTCSQFLELQPISIS